METSHARYPAGLRGQYLAFIDRHEIAWEFAFALLAIAYVIVGFSDPSPAIDATELALTAVFVLEFGSRLLASYDRAAYLRGHWVDAVALIPTTRAVRLLRLLRLLRLVRAFAGMYRVLGSIEGVARHRGLALLLAAWAAVMVITSLALYAAERGVNAAVDDPLDALWWGITTLTTVGYGDVVPVTPEGRLAATVLMVLGIGLFAAITSILTSYLVGADGRHRSVSTRLTELDDLRSADAVSDAEYRKSRARILRDI